MKKLVLLLLMSLPIYAFSQLGGDLKKDGREKVSDHSYVLEDTHNGTIIFEISVNAKGEVTSAKVKDEGTTIRSTPAKIKARNYVAQFKFAPGTWYPKYHQGTVQITMVRKL